MDLKKKKISNLLKNNLYIIKQIQIQLIKELDYLKRNNNRYKVYKDKKPYINRIKRLKNKI